MYTSRILKEVRNRRILHEVALELTYQCNLDCFFCYNDKKKAGKPLSLAQYREVLHDLARMQTLFLMLTGGEPLLHPHFFEIGQTARDLGFITRVRTNGHNLGQDVCERLKQEVDPYAVEVSLHGADAKTHDRQTRVSGSFARLLENIKAALKAGLRMNAVATPTAWNEHQIEAMFGLCDSLGIPLRFQGPVAPRGGVDTATLALTPSSKTWRLIKDMVIARNAAESTQQTADIPNESSSRRREAEDCATCGIGVMGVDIDPFGNVKPCIHVQSSAGNLHDESIERIWKNSPLFALMRERAVAAGQSFGDKPLQQLGAPLFCLAVEENLSRGRADVESPDC